MNKRSRNEHAIKLVKEANEKATQTLLFKEEQRTRNEWFKAYKAAHGYYPFERKSGVAGEVWNFPFPKWFLVKRQEEIKKIEKNIRSHIGDDDGCAYGYGRD
jgi:hypothetical protein